MFLLALTVLSAPAHADPEADKQRVDAQLAETNSLLEGATEKARAAALSYATATAALPNATAAAATARGVAAARSAVADQARAEADKARGAFAVASGEYTAAAGRVEEARELNARFAAGAYEGAGLMQMNVVLASKSPTDLADKLTYLDQVSQHRARSLEDYTAARLASKVLQNRADTARETAEGTERVANAALEAARQAEAEAVALVAATVRLAEQQKQALAAAEVEKTETLARYAELEAESARIGAALRAIPAQAPEQPVLSGYHGGYFPMPVHGAYKSSDFGSRYDPYYHVWQLHAGVDLAADGGTPIYAVADGRVAQAGWNGGYGNYTCINHGQYNGESIATCYAHQSSIAVEAGDYVRAGQMIGRIGTTGASTGNHLHFEVRLNGTPVQPLDFLPGCLC
ncbi:M23 family metallopeptidase [Longispora fulva]|uniref:Murein DD-endopeptidase MepM/ murein hydrolase activator NlpD n=1 Tax=Longispora fulva TaxID=619741 RepID=A0A8J7GMD5_9ACTN|nr:M23 family metallopeptidase [Longispora fulva]MBG6140425.1 murein DD-endopeptidase MepM/ murein hydrolase activator NlpD [Longispora fulva]